MENCLLFGSSSKTAEEYLTLEVNSILDLLTSRQLKLRLDMGMAVKRIRKMPLETFGKMQILANSIYDKGISVSSPIAVSACALLSRELASVDQPFKTDFINFRKLLISRCQMEFESLMSIDESIRNEMVQRIEDCTDPSIKDELSSMLEDYDKKLRLKSIRCIRFLGELYKQQILTAPIMKLCLNNLLDRKDDPSLESFCVLLAMVGKDVICSKFETNDNLRTFFVKVFEIADDQNVKISDDVRSMLQATIIDMSKWSRMYELLNNLTE